MKDRDRFIGEDIAVRLPDLPHPRRDPPAPESFSWRGRDLLVLEVLSEWWDYSRSDSAQGSRREGYRRRASRQGSYGVGRHYFLLKTDRGTFQVYYDRRPRPGRPEGSWVLLKEIGPPG